MVLVDSASAPVLPSPPPCVDSVIPVSAAMAEAGRCLLSQQAGILAGNNAGMAAYVAFVMGAKMEVGPGLVPVVMCIDMINFRPGRPLP